MGWTCARFLLCLVVVLLLLAGAAPVNDMRDRRMPPRSAPRGRIPLDDDSEGDIDNDFGPGGFGGNMRSMGGGAGPVGGSMERIGGGSMERMAGGGGIGGSMRDMGGGMGPMPGNMDRMAGGGGFGGNARGMGAVGGGMGLMRGNMDRLSGDMEEGSIMGSMVMNRMGGMMGPGLMAGFGGVGGGPMGLMGRNLDGLSRLASDLQQMNAVRGGNLRGMTGADRNMRRAVDVMDRGREREGRMERGGGGPAGRHDASTGRQQESDSVGTVVLVSNMNHEVLSTILTQSVLTVSVLRRARDVSTVSLPVV